MDRDTAHVNVVIAEDVNCLVHGSSMIEDFADHFQFIKRLFLWIIGHIFLWDGRHTDRQSLLIHAIERQGRGIEERPKFFEGQVGQIPGTIAFKAEVLDVHHGDGGISIRWIGEQKQCGAEVPVKVAPEETVFLVSQRGKE